MECFDKKKLRKERKKETKVHKDKVYFDTNLISEITQQTTGFKFNSKSKDTIKRIRSERRMLKIN